jgi:hypothetical protein
MHKKTNARDVLQQKELNMHEPESERRSRSWPMNFLSEKAVLDLGQIRSWRRQERGVDDGYMHRAVGATPRAHFATAD